MKDQRSFGIFLRMKYDEYDCLGSKLQGYVQTHTSKYLSAKSTHTFILPCDVIRTSWGVSCSAEELSAAASALMISRLSGCNLTIV